MKRGSKQIKFGIKKYETAANTVAQPITTKWDLKVIEHAEDVIK